MKQIARPFHLLYCMYAYLLFLLFLVIGFVYALPLSFLAGPKAHTAIFAYYKAWAHCWFFLTGIRMEAEGKEYLRQAAPCIIAGNHSTNVDLMNAVYMLPLKTKALAKAEIRKIPVMGYLFGVVSVFVDRKNKESREKSIRALRKRLDEGFSIFIYPEGTRNRTARPLNDFYDGAFRIAIETQRDVLPVCVINGRGIWPPRSLWMKPGKMKAIYLAPHSTKGMTEADVPALKSEVFHAMEQCILANDPLFTRHSP